MTESTKNLFDAPWYVFSSPDDEITVIENESGRVLAELDDVKTANRLARLPELYDALKESINDKCRKCINDTRRRGDKSYINPYDFIELGCPYNRTCVTSDYLKLLRKVRDSK